MGVLVMTGLFGCGKPQYKLIFDGSGFKSARTSYAEGAQVTVYYGFIATDTDYRFHIDAEDVKQDYDSQKGYVFTFKMPAHDVSCTVESHSSMMYDPDAHNLGTDPASGGNGFPEVGEIDESRVVFDYYAATVATVGGDEYQEMVLYGRDDEYLTLAYYSKYGDGAEHMTACVVPASVLDDCMEAVRNNKMDSWSKGVGLNGKVYVVKWLQDDGTLKRVSSEEMPENGRSAFTEIEGILNNAWAEYHQSTEPQLSEGEWVCPECKTINTGKYCAECGTKRPE